MITNGFWRRFPFPCVAVVSLFVAPAVSMAAPDRDALRAGEFKDPPITARPGAFWPWLNGYVDLERISYELEQMKEKGMSGADIWDVRANADPDKMIPVGPAFLGEESLEAIAHTLKEANRLGLRMGMIAASGWNAGGTWVQPADAGMGLFHSETEVQGPAEISQTLPFPDVPPACPKDSRGLPIYWKTVAVLAYPSNGKASPLKRSAAVDLTAQMDAGGKLHWKAPPGNWVVLRFVMANTGHQLVVPSPKSEGPMIDFLSPEATRKHFGYILDRLESKVGKLRASSLKYLEVDSMELGQETAWTGRVLGAFRKQHGYDAQPYLPVLKGWTVESAEITERFLNDWRRTISDVFIESHYVTGRRLLNKHGLELCAEAGGPGAPIWSSCPVESLKALGSVDVLRGEFWPKHRNIFLVKEISSAAHAYGKRIVDAESFTSWRHWQDGPYFLKQLADRALGEGLNHFTFHTFTHSPGWNKAGDQSSPSEEEKGNQLPGFAYHAGTHINPNIVWWPMARPFIDYLARCSLMLQKGRFVADVCYYYGDDAPNFVPSKHAGFSPGPGYDYDVVNSDTILNRMSVRDGRLVLPDGMSYAVLVLPDRRDMDLQVLRKIERLVRAGATVVGTKPSRTATLAGYPNRDREVAALADRIWGNYVPEEEHALGKGRILWGQSVSEALKSIGPDFSYRGTGIRTRLDYLHRAAGADDIYFVSNMNERWQSVDCVFRVHGKRPQLWHPETGAVTDLAIYEEDAAGTCVPLHLGPAESVFIVFRPEGPGRHFTRLERTGRPNGAQSDRPALLPHSATPGGPMWLSGANDHQGQVLPLDQQFIKFDLGAEHSLRRIQIWNYNENVRGYINYGVQAMDICISTNNEHYEKVSSATLKIAGENEDRDYSQNLQIDSTAARYVLFAIKSNHNRPGYLEGVSERVGLSKVRFFDGENREIRGVRVASISSGVAFDPASDEELGLAHPLAEVIGESPSKALLTAWSPGTYRLRDSAGGTKQVTVEWLVAPVEIEGAWAVNFPVGSGPGTTTFEHLVSWTERAEEDIKFFSGIATYKKSFSVAEEGLKPDAVLELDLGVVQHVARVSMNGKELGVLWKPPYSIDITRAVRSGSNELVVEVANTWNNRLIGDGGAPAEKRHTRTNLQGRFSRDEKQLDPSGLLGPVRIAFAKRVAVEP